MSENARRILLYLGIALGCSSHAPTEPPTQTPARVEPQPVPGVGLTTPAAPSPARAASSTPPVSSNAPAGCAPDAPPASTFTKLHAGPVRSAAVGTPPRAAIWTGERVIAFEGTTPHELGAAQIPSGAHVELFFGRDNQPRIMGFVPGASEAEKPVYLRYRQGTFRPEPSELGPLGSPHGALYGVLGFDDPEVVCRPRQLCLVKRTTGWRRVPAHDAPMRVVLRRGEVFALHADHIERLVDAGWSALEPVRVFEHPSDVWVGPAGELWVVDGSKEGVFRSTGGGWLAVASRVVEPRVVIGGRDSTVIVAGASGAVELAAGCVRPVRGVDGPLRVALNVGADIWLGGANGLYRLER